MNAHLRNAFADRPAIAEIAKHSAANARQDPCLGFVIVQFR
jgi:hypothetical protein